MPTQTEVKAKLDALTAGVSSLDDVTASIEQLLANTTKTISDLKAAAAASPVEVPQTFLDQLDAIAAALTVHRDKIAADVLANTPAA